MKKIISKYKFDIIAAIIIMTIALASASSIHQQAKLKTEVALWKAFYEMQYNECNGEDKE